METALVLGTINGENLTFEDLALEFKHKEGIKVLKSCVMRKVLDQAARDQGIEISEEELKDELERYFAERHIIQGREIEEYYRYKNLTREEVISYVKPRIQAKKIKTLVARDDIIEKVFAENKIYFEKREIAYALIKSESQAKELFCQLEEGEIHFADLVEKYSLEENNKYQAGYFGLVNRRQVPESVAAKIFSEDPKAYLGPIRVDNEYWIVRVINKVAAELNEAVKEQCVEIVFSDVIQTFIKKSKIELPGFNVVGI